MELKIFSTADKASKYVAKEIADFIAIKNSTGEKTVLGLATGNTPINVYQELVRLHKEGLSFKNVITFNLDEYYPMDASHKESYYTYMHNHLFDHVDIMKENIHIPDGSVAAELVDVYCDDYEAKIQEVGGIDIQLLGIGRTGHIAFNEPGSSIDSVTRLIDLDKITREDAANDFNGIENVPKQAITMGVRSILNAKKILLLTLGSKKAKIIKECLFGEVSSERPASYLQDFDNIEVILDEYAGLLIQANKTN